MMAVLSFYILLLAAMGGLLRGASLAGGAIEGESNACSPSTALTIGHRNSLRERRIILCEGLFEADIIAMLNRDAAMASEAPAGASKGQLRRRERRRAEDRDAPAASFDTILHAQYATIYADRLIPHALVQTSNRLEIDAPASISELDRGLLLVFFHYLPVAVQEGPLGSFFKAIPRNVLAMHIVRALLAKTFSFSTTSNDAAAPSLDYSASFSAEPALLVEEEAGRLQTGTPAQYQLLFLSLVRNPATWTASLAALAGVSEKAAIDAIKATTARDCRLWEEQPAFMATCESVTDCAGHVSVLGITRFHFESGTINALHRLLFDYKGPDLAYGEIATDMLWKTFASFGLQMPSDLAAARMASVLRPGKLRRLCIMLRHPQLFVRVPEVVDALKELHLPKRDDDTFFLAKASLCMPAKLLDWEYVVQQSGEEIMNHLSDSALDLSRKAVASHISKLFFEGITRMHAADIRRASELNHLYIVAAGVPQFSTKSLSLCQANVIIGQSEGKASEAIKIMRTFFKHDRWYLRGYWEFDA